MKIQFSFFLRIIHLIEISCTLSHEHMLFVFCWIDSIWKSLFSLSSSLDISQLAQSKATAYAAVVVKQQLLTNNTTSTSTCTTIKNQEFITVGRKFIDFWSPDLFALYFVQIVFLGKENNLYQIYFQNIVYSKIGIAVFCF